METPDALHKALGRCLERDEPALLEVPVGDMASPWPFIMRDRLFPPQESAPQKIVQDERVEDRLLPNAGVDSKLL